MTITERAKLRLEALEGREAPGGWGNWNWASSWSWRSHGSKSWDSGCTRRVERDCDDWKRSCTPVVVTCQPPPVTCTPKPPPVCQPPVPANSQVSGFVYHDADLSATFTPGEPLLPNVPMVLVGSTAGGVAVNRPATTDVNGAYNFGSLPAGNYTISVVTTPDGYVPGHSEAGGFGGTPGVNTVTGLTVVAGQSRAGYNFGMETFRPR